MSSLRSALWTTRLNNAQFWIADELTKYISSALVSWQTNARYWRSPVSFNTHPDGAGVAQSFYDLTVEIPQLSLNVTDSDILSRMQYHLLEPQSGIPSAPIWRGTLMWPQDAFTDAMQKRRDRFLLESASIVEHFTTNTVSAGTTRVVLPSSLIDVRRVSWVDANGQQTLLWRDDEFAANAYNPGWMNNPDTPVIYSVAVTKPFSIQLMPPPSDIGFLDILAIAEGPPLNPVQGVVLGIPDNYAKAVKWGAMADLLVQDGPATDVERAAYCEQRYLECVQMCRSMPTVINASINGSTCELDSVANFDAFNVGWNNPTNPYTTPTVLALASQTMLATSSVPDPSNPSSIVLDAVINCPLPPDDSTPIDITADVADLILDEAEHEARFKEGGAEAARSIAQHQNFLQRAQLYRDMSGARAPYWPAMERSNQLEFVARRIFR